MDDHPYTLHLQSHARNRAITENVQFHVSVEGWVSCAGIRGDTFTNVIIHGECVFEFQ